MGLTTNPSSVGDIISSQLHFKYLRIIFNDPFTSAFNLKPFDVINKPLYFLLPDELFNLSSTPYTGI
jgi:hypothetical protein